MYVRRDSTTSPILTHALVYIRTSSIFFHEVDVSFISGAEKPIYAVARQVGTKLFEYLHSSVVDVVTYSIDRKQFRDEMEGTERAKLLKHVSTCLCYYIRLLLAELLVPLKGTNLPFLNIFPTRRFIYYDLQGDSTRLERSEILSNTNTVITLHTHTASRHIRVHSSGEYVELIGFLYYFFSLHITPVSC